MSLEDMDDLLASLPMPTDCPDLPSFLECSKMKIAEAMGFLGDPGCYAISHLDMDPEYKRMFINLFRAASRLLVKVPEDEKSAQETHAALVHALAELEVRMPLYWCTITRHFLLHASEKLKEFGSFWACNMLCVERFHVLLKSMAKGSRNQMASLANNYDLFDRTQTDWRPDPTINWLAKPRGSSLAPRAIPDNAGTVEVKGARTPGTLTTKLFEQVAFVDVYVSFNDMCFI